MSSHHKENAERNKKILDSILSENQPNLQWTTIVLFYYATHVVQAQLLKLSPPIRPSSHYERSDSVSQHLNQLFPNIDVKFDYLWIESEKARYCPTISLNWNDNTNLYNQKFGRLMDHKIFFENVFNNL